ncbi:hypothetical protein TM7_0416 [candidate division TM7 genomosp. GTL1]|nr:hypothetical protein TM7_0416 [candidate division TM7 genomosp. GTL1]
MSSLSLVQKVWNYCNLLRDDGLSYGDYLEQITYLLFLKMADEYSKPPFYLSLVQASTCCNADHRPLPKEFLGFMVNHSLIKIFTFTNIYVGPLVIEKHVDCWRV